jgi:4'-phosphopantetheinyl transferase
MLPAGGTTSLLLKPGVVQIWATWLDLPAYLRKQLEDTLAPDEHNRAMRMVFERDRQAHIASRGILRQILAQYLGVAPQSLVFQYNEQGKPSLADNCGGDWLNFNVSHSGSLVLYAFRLEGVVGIDVEKVREVEDMNQIAASTFSAVENLHFQSLPVPQQVEAFFNCWTRKEAFIKAVGTGLSYPLTSFDVTLRPDEPARFVRIEGESSDHWTLIDLRPYQGFIGAVAVPASEIEVQLDWWDVHQHSTNGVQLRSI